MRYKDTHASTHDGSPAMRVTSDATTITLVNEDGFEWTDPIEMWTPITKPRIFAARYGTCEAFNVRRRGMCKAPLDDRGECAVASDHGDEFSERR